MKLKRRERTKHLVLFNNYEKPTASVVFVWSRLDQGMNRDERLSVEENWVKRRSQTQNRRQKLPPEARRRDRGFERECWDGGTCPCWFPDCEEHRGNGKKGCCWCRVGLLVSSWMSVRILWFFVATKTKMWMWHWSPHDSDNTYEPILFIIIQSSY